MRRVCGLALFTLAAVAFQAGDVPLAQTYLSKAVRALRLTRSAGLVALA
ncbi:MAG TPA: hypothetical protein VEA41_03030 [Salinarimonas sp.]|nr:hypothetical protein [Salinarimonas sp.]